MAPHCDSCTCEPDTVCFGIDRRSSQFAVRIVTVAIYLAIAILMGEFLLYRGTADWDSLRLLALKTLLVALSMSFTLLIVLSSMPYWECIWSIMLGIWYVTEDFVTNPPLLRFRDRFFGRRVNSEVRVSGPVNDCGTGDDPPTLPPKRKAVLRGEVPKQLSTIRIDSRPTSLTTSRDQQETETFGILPPREPITSPPVHKPKTRRPTEKDQFKKKINDIVTLRTIEESEETNLKARGTRRILVPLSHLLSKPSFSGETSEETSFSSVTDHSEVQRRSRISKYRDARKTSETDEQISAEESLPLFRAHESLQPSDKIVQKQKTTVQEPAPSVEIGHTQASGSKDIQMKRGQTSRSYVPVSKFGKMHIFKAKNVEKNKDQKRSSHGQTSTETLRHQSGSQIECGEIKQTINQKTAARSYVPVSTLKKPVSELHAAAKFEGETKRDTEQPAIQQYMISNILLKLQSAPDETKMPRETVAKEKSVQLSLGNVLEDQNTPSLSEGLPHPSSSGSRASNLEVQISNRPNLHLSSGFIVKAEEGATAAGSITNTQDFDCEYDQLEEVIDASHISVNVRFEKRTQETKYKKAVGEIQIKPSSDQPALKQTCEIKRLGSLEQTSIEISRGSYVRRRAGEDFSLTGVSPRTDAPAQIHQSMQRPSKDAASSSTGIEETSREISNTGRSSLHLSSGVTIVRDDSAEGRESPELQDIYDQPNEPIDATNLFAFDPSTDGSE